MMPLTSIVWAPLSVAELLYIASIPEHARWRYPFGTRGESLLRLSAEFYRAVDGTMHIDFAFPWPGRPAYWIGWRGVVCAVCNGVRVEANPPWACPVVECTCAK